MIATRPPGQLSGWNIGVIRWVKMPGQSDIEAGVERLAPSVEPVVIKIIHEDEQETDFMSGLLLPAIMALKQPQSLAAYKGTFKPDRVLYVDTGFELLKLSATALIESSNYYERFTFKVLES